MRWRPRADLVSQRFGNYPHLAACSSSLLRREGALIRKTLIPTAYYLLAAGVIGCIYLLVLSGGIR